MKRGLKGFAMAGLILAAVAVVCGLMAMAAWAGENVEPGPMHLKVRSIKIVDEDGKTCINIIGAKSGSGVWVQDPCDPGKNVAIYFVKGQGPVLSLMSDTTKPSVFAVAVDNGQPYFQVAPKGGPVRMIDVKDLGK